MTERFRASRAFRIAMTGVLTVSLVTVNAAARAPDAAHSAAKAQAALAKGQVSKAITHGEAAVAASPRDAAMRLTLAHAYLKAGRFASAAETFTDAMELGDSSPRTALALALSRIAAGDSAEAIVVLDDWRDSIPASDLGLAYALAGEGGRGVAILADGLRGGDNSPKLRQNLAYAYALDGRWREARMMAAQDLAAEKLDERIGEWAQNSRPEDSQRRIAALLGVPLSSDAGQPSHLALAPAAPTTPAATEQLAAETAAPAPAEAQQDVALAAAPVEPVASVPAEPAPAAALTFVSQPVVQPSVTYRQSPRMVTPRASRQPVTGGSHFVQLGAFSSEANAQRGKAIFTARNPELRGVRMTITPAVVNGRNVWRVAAAGYDNRSARGLCSTVKGRGGACFAYAATNPPRSDPARGIAGPQMARRR